MKDRSKEQTKANKHRHTDTNSNTNLYNEKIVTQKQNIHNKHKKEKNTSRYQMNIILTILPMINSNTLIINKVVLEPRVSPAFAITYFCNHCNIRFENTLKYVDTLAFFSKNLNQRSMTPRWPLTPCLLRSHVWLSPRIIVSKSHGNTSMYVDTVINFANYHIHTYTYIYILRTEWVIT